MEKDIVSWYISDSGVLNIFIGNRQLCEISDCKDYTDERVREIINEELSSSGYIWLETGEVTMEDKKEFEEKTFEFVEGEDTYHFARPSSSGVTYDKEDFTIQDAIIHFIENYY